MVASHEKAVSGTLGTDPIGQLLIFFIVALNICMAMALLVPPEFVQSLLPGYMYPQSPAKSQGLEGLHFFGGHARLLASHEKAVLTPLIADPLTEIIILFFSITWHICIAMKPLVAPKFVQFSLPGHRPMVIINILRTPPYKPERLQRFDPCEGHGRLSPLY